MVAAEAGVFALSGLLAAGAFFFLLGGVVKGTLGVGLPLVVVPLMSLLIPAPQAMGLLVVPVLLSNVWQAFQAGKLAHVRRFASLIAMQWLATILAVRWSRDWSVERFNMLLALAVLAAVLLMVLRPSGRLSERQERWASPLAGFAAGVMAGVSSIAGPVLISYLMALRLGREEFVGSISLLYLFAAVPMYGAMLWWGRFGWVEVGWSVVALGPVFLGMLAGTALRRRLSEAVFRRLLLAFLSVLALFLLFK